jgi:hypothetical protein
MDEQSARMGHIPMKSKAKKSGAFTSAVSATAIICLFAVLTVQLLENLA